MRKELSKSTCFGVTATTANPLHCGAAPSRLSRRLYGAMVGIAIIVAAATVVVPSSVVRAATDTVTNCSDSGPGSLRAVIAAATPGDIVVFTVSCSTVGLISGEIDVDTNLTISGPGSSALAVSGQGKSRVFGVGLTNPSASVSISGLTIADGTVSCASDSCDVGGAALLNAGTVTLAHDVLFRNNTATCSGPGCMAEGGAILNDGTLNVQGDGITAASNTAQCTADGCSALVGGVHNDGAMSVSGALALYDNVARCVGDSCGSAGAGFGGGGSTTVQGALSLARNLSGCEGTDCSLAGAGINIFGNGSLTVAGGDVDVSQNTASCVGSGCIARSGGLTANGPVRLERGTMRIVDNAASADTQHGAPGLVRGAGIAIAAVASVVVSDGSLSVMRNTASCASVGCIVQGGGIAKVGSLVLSHSRIIGNTAIAPLGVAQGGGLYNTRGSASLVDSPVNDNAAVGSTAAGGGIYVAAGSVTLDHSPVEGNSPDNCFPISLC